MTGVSDNSGSTIDYAAVEDVPAPVARDVLAKVADVWHAYLESDCSERDTGACTYDEPCPGCTTQADAWAALPDLMGAAHVLSHPTDYTKSEIADELRRWTEATSVE